MYLELAEGVDLTNYIFIPDSEGGKWLHIDMIPDNQFEAVLEKYADVQPMSEDDMYMSAGGRRRAFKEEKRAQKIARKAAKTEKKTASAEAKRMKAEGTREKRFGKGAGAAQRGQEQPGRTWQDTVGNILGTAGQVAGVFGGGQGEVILPAPEPEKSWFEKNWPWVVGGGLVLLVGGGLLITRKK